MRHLSPAIVALALVLSGAAAAPPPSPAALEDLIPRTVFFGNPDRHTVRVNPAGTILSYVAPHEGVQNVWVENLDGTDRRVVTGSTDRPIRNYFWAFNGEQIVYAQDREGDENFRLFAVNLDGSGEVELTPAGAQARLVAADRDFPDEILVALNLRSPAVHDVYRINTRSGESTLVFENDRNFASMLADSRLRIRVATQLGPDGSLRGFLRDADESDWYELATWGPEDAGISRPLGLSRDGRTLYLVDSRGADTGRLHAFENVEDLEASRYVMLAEHRQADLDSVVFDPLAGRPQAAAFDYARRQWALLDDSIKADWAYLASVSEGDFQIESRDLADRIWIVSYVRDDGPVSFYAYDRGERRARFLFTNRMSLSGAPLARMQPLVIGARDGLRLVSYLTTPRGVEPRDLPLVLLVHGGPWARDHWGYSGLHQWLANRGYAVLSVNFRGSSGFGKRFLNAGNLEWAGAMHDDLIDAVNWAVAQGIADADRVAIMGGSYGGYAALVGLTFTPEFFAAGVDIVGPSHVRTLLESIPPYWGPIRAMFETRVGRLEDVGFLDSISPLNRVEAIRRPLLIGQGANDPRVKESESAQIVQAMQSRNLPVTYVVFPDEGHGFARPENSLAFFAVTEAFLAQHLGGRVEPITSEIRASSAEIRAGAELLDLGATDVPQGPGG